MAFVDTYNEINTKAIVLCIQTLTQYLQKKLTVSIINKEKERLFKILTLTIQGSLENLFSLLLLDQCSRKGAVHVACFGQ